MSDAVTSSHQGVRYKDSKTRRNGIKPDRYFLIRYRRGDGTRREEGVGWASEGFNVGKAAELLATIKKNIRLGIRPQSIAEMRELEKISNEQHGQAEQEKQELEITVGQFWETYYLPEAKAAKKASTMYSEEKLYHKWIQPVLGEILIQDLNYEHSLSIQMQAQKEGRKASSVRFIMSILSQIWTCAEAHGRVTGDNPVKRVKTLREDNRRIRFLTEEEAGKLLKALAKRSMDVHDIALLSMFGGLRAGEIFALTWEKVDFKEKHVFIADTKTGLNRYAYITPEIEEMLQRRHAQAMEQDEASEYVFPSRNGQQIKQVSDTFSRVVEILGFNRGVADRRRRVVFHTLRHTFASWMIQRGVELFTVAELLGHTNLKMTRRYSHLAPDNVRNAAMQLTGIISMNKAS